MERYGRSTKSREPPRATTYSTSFLERSVLESRAGPMGFERDIASIAAGNSRSFASLRTTIFRDLLCGRSRDDSRVDGCHQILNHVNDDIIADRGVNHGVVDGAVGPFDV